MKSSSVSLVLIRSPTQKIDMCVVIKLQIMQQLITLVIFSNHKGIVIEV